MWKRFDRAGEHQTTLHLVSQIPSASHQRLDRGKKRADKRLSVGKKFFGALCRQCHVNRGRDYGKHKKAGKSPKNDYLGNNRKSRIKPLCQPTFSDEFHCAKNLFKLIRF